MYNGILLLDKPQGFTSHDIVAKLRGIMRQKRIGHAGTLDPMATGLLVILLGNATKTSDDAGGLDKRYIAGLRTGVVTATQDIWGEVMEENAAAVTGDTLCSVLQTFRGGIMQLPPMYSAVQVGGRRLYDLARRGIEVEREARPVTIHAVTAIDPAETARDFNLDITCSKGTYIRTLCHDVGAALGCGACMTSLRRTECGDFSVSDALGLDEIKALHGAGELASRLVPTDRLYGGLDSVTLTKNADSRAKKGAPLFAFHIARGAIPAHGVKCRVYTSGGEFIMTGIGRDIGGPAIACDTMFFIGD